MKCTQCQAVIPFDEEVGAAVDCLFCTGTQYAKASDILRHPSLGFANERRDAQVALTELIERTIEQKQHCVVEAGTGIGKSFAYLLAHLIQYPAKRTVVSTANKALQGQLAGKDLPYIKAKFATLGLPQANFTFEVLYGKSNYACRAAVKKYKSKALPQWDKYLFDVSESGLYSDMPPAKKATLRLDSSLTAEDCKGSRCSMASTCGFYQTRLRARKADVVICNHTLLGYDLAARLKETPNSIFGDNVSSFVIDEAHNLTDGLRNAFEYQIAENKLKKLLDAYTQFQLDVGRDNDFCDLIKLEKDWVSLFKSVSGAKTEPSMVQIDEHLANGILDALDEPSLNQHLQSNRSDQQDNDAAITVARHAADIRRCLQSALNGSGNYITYLAYENGTKTIKSSPVELKWHIKQLCAQAPVRFISATLAVGGSLDVFKQECGLDHTIPSAQYGSAFDLGTQALLYISKNIPEPTYAETHVTAYRDAVCEEIDALLTASQGNAFVLFTARAELIYAYERLKHKHTLFSQTEMPPAAALKAYHAHENSTLFGLKTFWEGVDIAGDKLSLVIIVKLPFPMKSDPIVNARMVTAGSKAFSAVWIPDMIIDLRQGVGRLIRSKTDRGVVALLDHRLNTKGYRKTVLASLNMPRVQQNLSAVLQSLQTLRKPRTC